MPRFDTLFGFDEQKSENGVWVDVPDGGRLKLGMIGSHAYNQALDKHIKRYRNLIRATGNLTVEQNTAVTIQVYADSVLLDWDGYEDEHGQPMKCTRENKVKMLTKYPNFKTLVESYAGDRDIFQEDINGDLGNLNSSSDGVSDLAT